MGHIGVLASYKEIIGQEPDLAAFRATLAEYNLGSLLACCCRLHIALQVDPFSGFREFGRTIWFQNPFPMYVVHSRLRVQHTSQKGLKK